MRVHTPSEVGARVRSLRGQKRLSQSQLAKQAGVSRKWLSDLERGKATVSLDLLFRVVTSLGGELDLRSRPDTRDVDVGAIVEAHRRP